MVYQDQIVVIHGLSGVPQVATVWYLGRLLLDKLSELLVSVMAMVLMVMMPALMLMEYFWRLSTWMSDSRAAHMWCQLCCIKEMEKDLTCLILLKLKECSGYLH